MPSVCRWSATLSSNKNLLQTIQYQMEVSHPVAADLYPPGPRFEFRFESFKSISVLILFVYKLMIGSSKNNRENYPRKCFRAPEKETWVKFNPGLSTNRPSNNWAQENNPSCLTWLPDLMNYGSYLTGIRSAPCWRVAPYNSTRSYFSLKCIPSLKHAFCHQYYCIALFWSKWFIR